MRSYFFLFLPSFIISYWLIWPIGLLFSAEIQLYTQKHTLTHRHTLWLLLISLTYCALLLLVSKRRRDNNIYIYINKFLRPKNSFWLDLTQYFSIASNLCGKYATKKFKRKRHESTQRGNVNYVLILHYFLCPFIVMKSGNVSIMPGKTSFTVRPIVFPSANKQPHLVNAIDW